MTQSLQPYRGSYLMPAFEKASVTDVMRPGVMSCAPDAPLVAVDPTTSLAEAATLMDKHGTSHMIVSSGGRPAGVVSSLDIAGALAWGRR